MFESTLNPETRRTGGMHYTFIENIHKVIDPLFLGSLRAELNEIRQLSAVKTRETRLKAFQSKLAELIALEILTLYLIQWIGSRTIAYLMSISLRRRSLL